MEGRLPCELLRAGEIGSELSQELPLLFSGICLGVQESGGRQVGQSWCLHCSYRGDPKPLALPVFPEGYSPVWGMGAVPNSHEMVPQRPPLVNPSVNPTAPLSLTHVTHLHTDFRGTGGLCISCSMTGA